MTSLPISRALREQVKQRADFRCEYCQTSEWLSGAEGEIDHVWRSQRAQFGPGLAIIHLPRSNPSRDRQRIKQTPIDYTNPVDVAALARQPFRRAAILAEKGGALANQLTQLRRNNSSRHCRPR